jgi:hypothetical protein
MRDAMAGRLRAGRLAGRNFDLAGRNFDNSSLSHVPARSQLFPAKF